MKSPHGVLETSLYITDLDRAVAFYRDVLGLRLINDAYFPGERGAAMQVGTGPSVLLLFRAEWREQLARHGVKIAQEFAFGNNPPSIYFYDPDGNVLELAVETIWALEKS